MPDSGNNAFVLATDPTRGLFVVREKNGKWGLPGGGIKSKETPFRGALREFREETGIKLTGIQELYTHKGKSGHTITFYAAILDPRLDYPKIFATRTTPKETTAFSFAVYPEGAPYPYVLSRDGTEKAASFEDRGSWRRGVSHTFKYFPRISKLEHWKRTLFRNNPSLAHAADVDYIMFALERCAESSKEPELKNTRAYQECLAVVDEWKYDGVFREESLDRYREYLTKIHVLVDKFFSGYRSDILGYRGDSNHLDPANRDAWSISLCHDKAKINSKRYTISAEVKVFPIFLFDRKDGVYNECEVLALAAHNRREFGGFRLTPFSMDRVRQGFSDHTSASGKG